ncbi:hypothetical protein [Camelimonas lactis]|uniref:hypothetical protein n=1 Tax=Camelimonas lactis TaxID=659006 RepID=UPI0010454849|nr:hypothetical protein [Camelimonas lactis]
MFNVVPVFVGWGDVRRLQLGRGSTAQVGLLLKESGCGWAGCVGHVVLHGWKRPAMIRRPLFK